MIGSRVRERRTQVSVDIKLKTLSGGQFSESNAYTSLIATKGTPGRLSPGAIEVMTDAGMIVVVTDVFWFAKVSGSLPAITEKHVIVNGSSRYEVISVQRQGGEGNRLKVMTRALR